MTQHIDGIHLQQPEEGRVLPPATFTSPALFEAELTSIFEHAWLHIADVDDLREPGDFATAQIGRVPVVALRGHDGGIKAFLNACRHRGASLAEGRGNCGKQLQCPYHAWSYATDGTLVGVPHREEFAACDLSQMNLIPIRTATLGPLVFGCLDPSAPSFDTWAGDIVGAVARARGSDMRASFEFSYDVRCNWKVYVENGLEGYHVGFVHDMLADFVERSGAEHFLEKYSSYTHAPINEQFRNMIPTPDHLTEDDNFVRFGHIFPNLIPVITPADFSYLRIDPIAHDRIRLHGRSFDLEGPGRDIVDFRRDSFDRTNKQDIAVVERVQVGLQAKGLPAGVCSSHLEKRIAHFESMFVREMQAHSSLHTVRKRVQGSTRASRSASASASAS